MLLAQVMMGIETYLESTMINQAHGQKAVTAAPGTSPTTLDKDTGFEQYIKLRSVKTLKPVGQSQPANPNHEDWITPKVYKGTSDRENA
jgi:hypothetical protein